VQGTQTPLVQLHVAAQTCPQLPQLLVSELVSTQVPPQHDTAQTFPQVPQLLASIFVEVHVPLQHVLGAKQHVGLAVPQRLLVSPKH
jgi:hypothetical protein